MMMVQVTIQSLGNTNSGTYLPGLHKHVPHMTVPFPFVQRSLLGSYRREEGREEEIYVKSLLITYSCAVKRTTNCLWLFPNCNLVTYLFSASSWQLPSVNTIFLQIVFGSLSLTCSRRMGFTRHIDHSTKLYRKLSRVCCRLCCYECAAQASNNANSNKRVILFQYSLVLW